MSNAEPQAETWVHFNGKLVPQSQAALSYYDHGFLYGDGAFEGIRVYSSNIFRLEAHLVRLLRSCKALGFELNRTLEELTADVVAVCRANKHQNGYIRFSVSRGVGLGLDPRSVLTEATRIISTEQLRLYPQEAYERGLDTITASTRIPPACCIDPQVKSLGKYINNIAAKTEANRVGAGEALMLNMEGNVAEATGDNLFLIKDGLLSTPPTSQGALPGITRAAVLDLAKRLGLPHREAVITLYDVYNADEGFLTGTAAEVIPMISADGRTIGTGKPGELTNRLISAFRELTLKDGTAL